MNILAIVSRSLPPMVIGSPILLHNLLDSYKGSLVGIGGWQSDAKIDPKLTFPGNKVSYLKSPNRYIQKFLERPNLFSLEIIKTYVFQKLKYHKANQVLGVCPNGEYFVAAFLAARKLNLPFFAHMHDLWLENAVAGSFKYKLANKWEKKILTSADRVFCMTDIQAEHYMKKYGIRCDILPHTIKTQNLPSSDYQFDKGRYSSKERIIVYTGNVNNPINMDAMRQFVKAVDFLPEYFKIKIFISHSENELKQLGLYRDRIEYDWKSISDVKKDMKEAHILFLPLSFKNCSLDEVKTVFATKTLDYLISGTPILQFAPENCFHTLSAKKGGWAHCVTIDDPQHLSQSLIQVVNDVDYCEDLVKNALSEAHARRGDIFANKLFDISEQQSKEIYG